MPATTYSHPVSVTMESVDAIAFFAVYWIWFEQAFEGFIAAVSGRTWREVVESGLGIPVVHAEIDHLKPIHLSDKVRIELRLLRTGRRSVEFEARYLGSYDEPVAVARTVHVITTRGDLAEAPMPEWQREVALGVSEQPPTDDSL